MTPPVREGLTHSTGLARDEYVSIQSLAALCNEHAGILLKLNEFMLQKRPKTEVNDFLFYVNGELVGFLGVYQFNQHEVELSGMVHPSLRRQGIFSTLVRAAMSEVQRRGISKLIFINAQTSKTGREFLLRLGAEYSFSEYWMQLVRDTIPVKSPAVRLRPYEFTDRDVVAQSLCEGFEMTVDDALASLDGEGSSDSDRVRYAIECDGHVVGTLSVQHSDARHAFIFGFAVLREQRGRGYGRQALMQVIQQAKQEHRTTVELEVAAANDGALSLYRSCGFEALRANDYYVSYV